MQRDDFITQNINSQKISNLKISTDSFCLLDSSTAQLQKKLQLNRREVYTESDVDKKFYNFLKDCHRCQTEEEKTEIKKAYLFAKEAHLNSRRNSGDAFIYHLFEVARIVTEDIGLGKSAAISALLHEVLAETEFELQDIKAQFGSQIANIVEALTKIKGTSAYFQKSQADVYRKIILGLSVDLRVIIIKLADRLHNMRTLEHSTPEYQIRVANETMFVYAPLAQRLGLYPIKSELEDLAFKYLNPIEYNRINDALTGDQMKRQMIINRFSIPIISKLSERGIEFNIKDRVKSIYSIYNKIQKKKVTIDEVYDKFAVRIIYKPSEPSKEKEEAKEICRIINELYRPVPERTRNWIDKPKQSTGYMAMHTTVQNKDGRFIEVQIRSEQMNEVAEKGLAAHWKYKGIEDKKVEFDNRIQNLSVELEDLGSHDFDYLNNFKFLISNEIIIYTPKGDIKRLPEGATILDFAASVHTELLRQCIGAKVNYKPVTASYVLKNGDVVEVLTSKHQKPKLEWKKIAITPKAHQIINKFLKTKEKEIVQKAKEQLNLLFQKHDVEPNNEIFNWFRKSFEFSSENDFLSKLAIGEISENKLEKIIKKYSRKQFVKYWQLQLLSPITGKKKNGEGTKIGKTLNSYKTNINKDINSKYAIAGCCNPIPGDHVIGIYTLGKNIEIHKYNCKTAQAIRNDSTLSVIQVKWTEHKVLSYPVKIEIEGIDEKGIINKIVTMLSKDFDLNMKAIHIEADDIGFSGWVEVFVYNTTHLEQLIEKLEKIEGIHKAKRESEEV